MATLDAPDTVIPVVKIHELLISPDDKLRRPPRVLRPAENPDAYYKPLQPYAALFDSAPTMREDQVRHKPNPAFVPFAMGRRIGDDDVKWTPPPPPRPPRIDVSSAETVEKLVPPPPPKHYDPPQTRIVAYDDSDPFPSTMRRLRNSADLEPSGVRTRDTEMILLGLNTILFNADNSLIWLLDNNDLGSGWKRVPCLGQPPPIGTLLFSNAEDRTIVALSEGEYFVLEVLHGEAELRWARCKIHESWNRFTVLWAQQLDDVTFYIRSKTEHAIVTPMEALRGSKVKTKDRIIHTIASRIVSPHEILCHVSTLRSTPINEPLEAVQGLHGTAILRCHDHVWVYVYLAKARNYLPVKRVDVINPLWVTMPQGLYLFAPPPGMPRSGIFQASHRIVFPAADTKVSPGLPDLVVEDAKRDGELTLRVHRDDIAVLAPMNDNCVAVITKDLENYVVVQLDRIAKLRRALQPPTDSVSLEKPVDLTKLLY